MTFIGTVVLLYLSLLPDLTTTMLFVPDQLNLWDQTGMLAPSNIGSVGRWRCVLIILPLLCSISFEHV